MRRVLREWLPAFSYHFGIRPWELDHLSSGEIEALIDFLKEMPDGP